MPTDPTVRGVYADWLEEHGFDTEAQWQRSGGKMTGKEFRDSLIAQDDSGGYDQSGWVACVVRRPGFTFAVLSSFGHCSCYDTWSSLSGGGISDYFPDDQETNPSFEWIGSVEELLEMARTKQEPGAPGPLVATDGYLLRVYEKILARATDEPPPAALAKNSPTP